MRSRRSVRSQWSFGRWRTYARAKDEFDLALHRGEILFAGDTIHTGDAAPTELLLCPAGRVVSLPPQATADVSRNQIRASPARSVSTRAVAPCEFPEFDPVPRAAEYHLGASLFTSSNPPPESGSIPAPRDETEVADLLSRLVTAEESKQDAASLALATALASYWPEATAWKARIFQHGEAVAASKEPARVGRGAYAVVIGISQYKSRQASQLDYAHLDAQMIYNYLINPRGAAIPADHIRLLLNSQATVSAIRDAFANVEAGWGRKRGGVYRLPWNGSRAGSIHCRQRHESTRRHRHGDPDERN